MMSPKRLLEHFEQISEAPDAIPRLRRFILDLAVRGKLVEQDPKDEPAEALLKRIDAARQKKAKGQLALDESMIPYDLPTLWQWVPIRRIAADRGQKVPDKKFTYIDVSAIDKERGLIAEPQMLKPDEAPSRARKIVKGSSPNR